MKINFDWQIQRDSTFTHFPPIKSSSEAKPSSVALWGPIETEEQAKRNRKMFKSLIDFDQKYIVLEIEISFLWSWQSFFFGSAAGRSEVDWIMSKQTSLSCASRPYRWTWGNLTRRKSRENKYSRWLIFGASNRLFVVRQSLETSSFSFWCFVLAGVMKATYQQFSRNGFRDSG